MDNRRLIDANKLKSHYSWWEDDERKKLFDDIVDAQPTVNVEPATGTWTEEYIPDEDPIFRRGYKCSACGKRNYYGFTRYCPECGARMDKDE